MNIRQTKYYQELLDVVTFNEGRIISNSFINAKTKLLFECKEGHQWLARPSEIKGGTWCKLCKDEGKRNKPRNKITIETLHETASMNSGECLSETYVNAHTYYQWKCHVDKHPSFSMRWAKVQQGQWCPECRKIERVNKRKESISTLQEFAAKKQGFLLSKKYINNRIELEWKCSDENHPSFWMCWDHVRQGSWCKECHLETIRVPTPIMEEMAKKNNGKLISRYCKNTITYGVWKCENSDHPPFCSQWNTVRQGSWCKKCSGNCPKEAEKKFIKRVFEKGGKVLGDYINSYTHVRIQCNNGHIWETSPGCISNAGSWCPLCKRSLGEEKIAKYLEELDILFSEQYRHPCIPRMRYDFSFKHNKVNYLLEFDGAQHFKEDPSFFHKKEGDFEHRQNLDLIKTYIALETGYKIIRIDYTQIDHIKEHITKAIESQEDYYLSSPDLYQYIMDSEIPIDILDKYAIGELFEKMRVI